MTKKDLKPFQMDKSNVKLLTGIEADLFIFTIEQFNEILESEMSLLKKKGKKSRQSPIKICAACGSFAHGNPGHDIII